MALSFFVLSASARAQCLDWKPEFGVNGVWGIESEERVHALATFDDGTGPALYVGGVFKDSGGVGTAHIARWDGASWSALGSGTIGRIYAMTVFDDGTGPALYAGGDFTAIGGIPANRIAKWDGAAWSALGSGIDYTNSQVLPAVRCLAVYDDGSGPALYAGGEFDIAGGAPANFIARWDGASWSGVGGGMSPGFSHVRAMTTFDDGSGLGLYAGGNFAQAGGASASSIARWDGSTWQALGSGFDPGEGVNALAVFDDGTGPAIHVGGRFLSVGGVPASSLARWDGSAWFALGSGIDAGFTGVNALAVYDDGIGARLYAGGSFNQAGGGPASNIARWDGANWSPMAAGTSNEVRALATFDDGSGAALYVGGYFDAAGGLVASRVARWKAGWSVLADGSGNGLNGQVHAMTVHNDGPGAALYVGGSFTAVGSLFAKNIARWDGSSWTPLGGGVEGPVYALAVYNGGSGPALYAGGNITQAAGVSTGRIASWNGSTWSTLGSGVSGLGGFTGVRALAVHDDGSGPAVYVGGAFTSASGIPANYIARWNGSWASVGTGFDYKVNALAVFDDGTGPALYAGGQFTHSGGVAIDRIARWDGSSWSDVGGGMGGLSCHVSSLKTFDDGSGLGLYAGGTFVRAGGLGVENIARWNGSTWAPVGNGLSRPPSQNPCFFRVVRSLAVFDDGLGPALFAGGAFQSSGATPLRGLAKWNGSNWSSVGGGVSRGWLDNSHDVNALTVYDDGSGGARDLYVGGQFHRAGTSSSSNLALWLGCPTPPGVPFCFGDGSGAPCPCANTGLAGRGCQNSASTGGARLVTNGSTHPDTVVLAVSGERASALTIFLQGNTEISAVAFGDGLRCAGGTLKRLYSKSAIGGVATAPERGEMSITSRSAALGDPIAPGTMRVYMTYYRDPGPRFCPVPAGSTFNSSGAVRIPW
jgi:hypothetical protein